MITTEFHSRTDQLLGKFNLTAIILLRDNSHVFLEELRQNRILSTEWRRRDDTPPKILDVCNFLWGL